MASGWSPIPAVFHCVDEEAIRASAADAAEAFVAASADAATAAAEEPRWLVLLNAMGRVETVWKQLSTGARPGTVADVSDDLATITTSCRLAVASTQTPLTDGARHGLRSHPHPGWRLGQPSLNSARWPRG